MALKLYERYPQLWESPSNDYPQGAFKNLSAQGETDGSYLEKDWLNDYSGFFGALLKNAQMTPNGEVDTAQRSQFYDALVKVAKKSVTNALNKKWDIQTTVGSGKVMREGAYGLGNTITIPINSNLNDYIYNGFYAVAYARDADTIENLPDKIKTKCSIVIYCSDSNKNVNDCTQIATHYNSTLTAIRTYYAHNDRWTDWYYIYNTQNTSTDKSGFLRASGSANALTEADAIPVGTVQAYVGETAPNDKWLLCRGQAFSAESYPDLAQLLPDLKIPDLRGVALRGLDANRGFDPDRKLLSYQEDAMQKITGSLVDQYNGSGFSASGAFKLEPNATNNYYGIIGEPDYLTLFKFKLGDLKFDSSLTSRSNTQNETVMKNVAVNFIIKAR